MWRTRRKLDEAAYFLHKVQAHYYDALHAQLRGEDPPPEFHYYLSAFVSAARSVTWVMRSEYSATDGWEEWFKTRVVSAEDRELLRGFNELRVRSEKIAPLNPGHHIEIENEEVPPLSERDPTMPRSRLTITEVLENDEPGEVLLEAEVRVYQWRIDQFQDEELLTAARRYTGLLSSLVEECEAAFDAPAV